MPSKFQKEIRVRLSQRDYDEITKLSHQYGAPRAWVVRTSIKYYLHKKGVNHD